MTMTMAMKMSPSVMAASVKTHISRIFAKTGSRDRVAAIGYARRHNLG
jgi:DNA-binding CsgD family transcriptional regulator